MEIRSRLEQANDNAARFWLAQAAVRGWRWHRRPGFTAVRCVRDERDAHRVVVTRPYAQPRSMERELRALLQEWQTVRVCVEDPYGGLDLTHLGCERALGRAVMAREPGAAVAASLRLPAGRPGDLRVEEVGGRAGLAEVERTVVVGTPVPLGRPRAGGDLFPQALLGVPGYRAWLARVDGRAAGACMTYDDGATVGLYWVATLPEYRSRGVARAAVETALAAYPDRVATLVATLLGEPLYRRLGFVEQGETTWWSNPGAAVPLD